MSAKLTLRSRGWLQDISDLRKPSVAMIALSLVGKTESPLLLAVLHDDLEQFLLGISGFARRLPQGRRAGQIMTSPHWLRQRSFALSRADAEQQPVSLWLMAHPFPEKSVAERSPPESLTWENLWELEARALSVRPHKSSGKSSVPKAGLKSNYLVFNCFRERCGRSARVRCSSGDRRSCRPPRGAGQRRAALRSASRCAAGS